MLLIVYDPSRKCSDVKEGLKLDVFQNFVPVVT